MKLALKSRAIKLRERGWSYNVIEKRLEVSKSTLSIWLRDIPFKPNAAVRKRIREGPAKAAVTINAKRRASIRVAKKAGAKQVGDLTKRDLFMLGIALYIGEGTKAHEQVQVINADTNVIRLAMRWFREVCRIPEENFSAVLHTYPDNSESSSLKYWSGVTGIPKHRFGKTQTDYRKNKSDKKRRILPYGTVHIRIRSRGNPEFGVALHRRIMGMIEETYKQAGIV